MYYEELKSSPLPAESNIQTNQEVLRRHFRVSPSKQGQPARATRMLQAGLFVGRSHEGGSGMSAP